MDYEMSLILASYLMGMHESRVTDCYITASYTHLTLPTILRV